MSNKNISQSITEAWAKSVATGMVQSQKKEQKRQQLDETSAALHNKAVQHILENDKGFYRPDTDPFFRKVDGDLLRRQRLAEQQAPMPPEAGPALDDETKERRKRYETAFEGPITGREQGKIDSEMEAIKKKEQEEIAKRDAQAQTGINPESERYRGRRNEAGLRGDPDFDPTAPGSQREVRAAQVQDNLGKVGRVFRGGRRLTGGYAGPGVNYGGAVAVGQMAPRELSPEERERQREEQAERSRTGAEERLKGLDAARREKLEKGLAPDADLETITTAIARERGAQDRVSELQAAGYGEGDYDPSTGGLTDQGMKKRRDRQVRAGKRRAGVRARAEARQNIQRDKADARAARLAARREARKKERLSGSGTALAGKKPTTKVSKDVFTNPGTQSSGDRGQTEINGDTPIQAGGAPESPENPRSIPIGMKETGTDGKTYVWDGQVWELDQ